MEATFSIVRIVALLYMVSFIEAATVPVTNMMPTSITTHQTTVEAQVMEVTTARMSVQNPEKISLRDLLKPVVANVEVSHSHTVTKVPTISISSPSMDSKPEVVIGENYIGVIEANHFQHDIVTKVPMILQPTTQNHIQVVKATKPIVATTNRMPTLAAVMDTVTTTTIATETMRTTTEFDDDESTTSTMSPDVSTTTWMPTTDSDEDVSLEDQMRISTVSSMAVTVDPCDLECTKLDLNPVCATNGDCVHEFPNDCVMRTYNCRHPMQQFTLEPSMRCHLQNWLSKCTAEDLQQSSSNRDSSISSTTKSNRKDL